MEGQPGTLAASRAALREYAQEGLWFAYKEALCATFAISIFVILAISKVLHVPGLPRYDLILIACIAVQAGMMRWGGETLRELEMICVFHVLGLSLEIYKVAHGAWAYPGAGYSKVLGVPLYSGFMYSSIASYMAQAFRRFDLMVLQPPKAFVALPLAALIYVNFFTDGFLYDIRWILSALVFLVYFKTKVDFLCHDRRIQMPLAASFLAIAVAVWVAENVCTLFQGYRYPDQQTGWVLVHGSKIGSWFLLVILSYIAVEWQARRRPGA